MAAGDTPVCNNPVLRWVPAVCWLRDSHSRGGAWPIPGLWGEPGSHVLGCKLLLLTNRHLGRAGVQRRPHQLRYLAGRSAAGQRLAGFRCALLLSRAQLAFRHTGRLFPPCGSRLALHIRSTSEPRITFYFLAKADKPDIFNQPMASPNLPAMKCLSQVSQIMPVW